MKAQKNTLGVKERMLNAVEQELVDFDAIEDVPKEGIVTVEPIRKNKVSGDFNHTLSCYQDPNTGEWYGIPERLGDDGKYVFRRIKMTGSKDFNLSNPRERMEFIILKHYPHTIGSPFQQGKPKYKVYDPLEEAEKGIAKHSARRKASGIVDDLIENPERRNDLIGFSRIFGFRPEVEHLTIIKKLMLDKVENDPHGFLEKWENKELRNAQIAIKRGIATALIKNQPGKGYIFNGVPIGSSEQIMTSYFLENTDAMHQLDIEGKQADKLFDQELSIKLAREEVQAEANGHDQTGEIAAEAVAEIPEVMEEATVEPEAPEEEVEVANQEEVDEMITELQNKCRKRGFPAEEWDHFSTVGELQDYMTSKASGGYDE